MSYGQISIDQKRFNLGNKEGFPEVVLPFEISKGFASAFASPLKIEIGDLVQTRVSYYKPMGPTDPDWRQA